MDPITCCLLGICCPPLKRQEKIAAHFERQGATPEAAAAIAADLIERIDALVTGAFLTQVIDAARSHKG